MPGGPRKGPRQNWAPLIAGLGSAVVLAAGGHSLAMLSQMTQPAPEPVSAVPAPSVSFEAETPGERAEASEVPAPAPAPAPVPGAPAPSGRVRGRLAGRVGPMGPLTGPMNTSLPDGGPVRGPLWTRTPLPGVGPGSVLVPEVAVAPPLPASRSGGESELSSELPNARALALSQLANPQPQVRTVEPRKAAEASAEKPLTLRLSIPRPAAGYRTGDTITVRMSASADCYATLIRVDGAGKASTVFRAPAPSHTFACALKAGPAGTEHLAAVASVRPLSAGEVASALRTAASGVVLASDGGRGLARYEYAVASADYVTQAPRLIATKPAEKPDGERPAGTKPATQGEGSALPPGTEPAPAPPKENGTKPEAVPDSKASAPKPAEPKEPAPAPKGEGTQPAPPAQPGSDEPSSE